MCPLPRSWWPPTTTPTSTLQSSAPPCDCPCAFSSTIRGSLESPIGPEQLRTPRPRAVGRSLSPDSSRRADVLRAGDRTTVRCAPSPVRGGHQPLLPLRRSSHRRRPATARALSLRRYVDRSNHQSVPNNSERHGRGLWAAASPLIRLAGRTFFGLEIERQSDVPPPPFVVATNHYSHFDAPVIGAALRLPVRFLVVADLFGESRLLDWFVLGSRSEERRVGK